MEFEVKISKERWKEIRQEERETNRDNSAYYHIGFINGAVWSDVTILDKVCEWLDDNAFEYVQTETIGINDIYKGFDSERMIADLKKAMEEKL